MTPTNQTPAPCPNPTCDNVVTQKPKGRRRLYCSEECGRWYRKYCRSHPEGLDNDEYALQLAEKAHENFGEVVSLTGQTDKPIEAAVLLQRVLGELEHLRAALIQQSSDRKIKPSVLADALHVSTDTLSRWKESNTRRRDKQTPTAKPSTPPPGPPAAPLPLAAAGPLRRIPAPRHPEPGPPRQAPIGGAPGQPSTPAASTTTTAATLSRALSQLQRESRLTYTVLGEAAGVSRSYVSRILSGERAPSWKVTQKLAEACGADPDDLRPLWEAARGYRVASPGNFHAALRGMQLAAGNLRPEELSARTGHTLTKDQVAGLLHGTRTADWPTVSTLVTALRGQPDTIRPLWQATQPRPAAGSGPHGSTFSTIPAGSLG